MNFLEDCTAWPVYGDAGMRMGHMHLMLVPVQWPDPRYLSRSRAAAMWGGAGSGTFFPDLEEDLKRLCKGERG
ncbi:MAG TPA: hypothetical protein VNS22_26960 [Geminicoccus sp.]|uniref:hypothetical protein n=1 Tax=Geminicoccus sp. TaxID=2024832 RepID=UPI002CF276C0|nr:hypothetical protein [Geminicoccus sp.]HWL72001.1 hypothetical protein [Geminicoccus sp.]